LCHWTIGDLPPRLTKPSRLETAIAMRTADALGGLRTQALGLLTAISGGRGLVDFVTGLVQADAAGACVMRSKARNGAIVRQDERRLRGLAGWAASSSGGLRMAGSSRISRPTGKPSRHDHSAARLISSASPVLGLFVRVQREIALERLSRYRYTTGVVNSVSAWLTRRPPTIA